MVKSGLGTWILVLFLMIVVPVVNGFYNPSLPDGLCSTVIEPAGYICFEQSLETKDGFVLGLQRFSSNQTYETLPRGPPVLLLHGLFMGGDAWFANSVDQSLGFLLADLGYEIWVANVRASQWSHGHVSLSRLDSKFWDWTWQDMAQFDLPAMINYINNITRSKLFVVGHSQGTTISLAAFTDPELVNKLLGAALLAPISYLDHLTAPLPRLMTLFHLDDLIMDLPMFALDFNNDITTALSNIICTTHTDCTHLLTSITGTNCCFNDSRLNFVPQPTSTKNLHHLAQMVRSGHFAKYDYGASKNTNDYGTFTPPHYNLADIPAYLPLWIAHGGNDELADVTDVKHTLRGLQSQPETTLYLDNYGHLDFLLSSTVKADVYDSLVQFLRNHTTFF